MRRNAGNHPLYCNRPLAVFQYGRIHLTPNNAPSFRCLPCFVVGMPVAFAILPFAEEIPVARFKLNDSPGIPLFFFAIFLFLLIYGLQCPQGE